MNDMTKEIRSMYASYSERDQKLIKYSVQCIAGELSKLIILFVTFAILKLWIPFCISFAVLSSFRFTSGGLHFNHYWSCLGFSFGTYLTICYILPTFVDARMPFLLIMTVASSIVIIWLSPIPSEKRPQPSPKRMKQYKYLSIALAFVWMVIAFAIHNSMTANLIEYTIAFQAVQMLFAYIKKFFRRELVNHEKKCNESRSCIF